MATGFVVWFTGLSGSGKSTLAAMLSAELIARGVHVEVLDGDEVRTHLSKGLTFSREDRDTNIRRIGFVAKLIARSGGCAMTAAISPYRSIRDEQRAQIPHFVEVYCRASVAALAERDVKGLYKKALAGEIKHFTGVDDPYEEPEGAEVVALTDSESKEASLAKILAKLEELGYVEGAGDLVKAGKLIAPHGGELTQRVATGDRAAALLAKAKTLPSIALDERQARDLSLLASGAFSPLKGFMNAKDYLKVVRSMRLETGVPWAMPITLAVTEEAARGVSVGAEVALVDAAGSVLGVLTASDKWTPDRALEAREVYGTESLENPHVARLFGGGEVYLGGEIEAVAAPLSSPQSARKVLSERGRSKVIGLWSEGPMLRADEHITKAALETADALCVLVAPSADLRLSYEASREAVEALLAAYYPSARVTSAACPDDRGGAGARGALHAALVAKNHGVSHLLIAASAEVEALFASFSRGQVAATPVFFERAFRSAKTGDFATDKTAPDAGETWTMSAVADALEKGEAVSEDALRPEVLAVFRGAARRT